MPLISIVSPVYRAEKTIDELIREVVKSVSIITADFEIILIDDGSPDLSWERIGLHCRRDRRIKGIRLSRNFGQHNAITAGLSVAAGDWIVVMDCDLQDRPDEIPNLYHRAQEGYDIVLARRVIRQDKFWKRWSSKLFFLAFGFLTNTQQDPAIANFGIYQRKVIHAILSMGDYVRVFPVLVQWIGFNKIAIDVKHAPRREGKSSYTIGKLFRLAFDMMLSFSEKPLRIGLRTGLIISLGALCFGVYNFILYLQGEILVPGYTSLIISVWFLSGIIISFIGLIGLYIGKIFEKVKSRPNYIITQKNNI